jgi:hypothetical protein
MPEVHSRPTTDIGARRVLWEGLGDLGFGYMDSLADTGGTLVPRCSRLAGGTGAFGDPRSETVAGVDEEFAIFAKAGNMVPRSMLDYAGDWRSERPYEWDMVMITPLRVPLQRPRLSPALATPQVELVEVLNALRSQAGLPVSDLAAMLGVSRRQFYNWIGHENEPDTSQEQRVRHSAALVDELHKRMGDPRMVRGALLTATSYGSAFDALRADDLARAHAAIDVVVGEQLRDVATPSQRLSYDRGRVLGELEYLRDAPLRGDG